MRTGTLALVVVAALATCATGCERSRATDDTTAAAAARSADTTQLVRNASDTLRLTRVDSTTYHLTARGADYTAIIGTAFHNTTPDTVFFVNCNSATSARLEMLVNEAWVPAWDSVQDQCLSPAIAVAPGATVTRPVNILGGHWITPIDSTRTSNMVGTDRLVWTGLIRGHTREQPFGTPLSIEQRASQRFTLVFPARR